MSKLGILLLAYGSPRTTNREDIRSYLTHILQFYRRVTPTAKEVEELRERYLKTGGPRLVDQMLRLKSSLAEALANCYPGVLVEVGMRHSPPWIKDAVQRLVRANIRTLVAIPMAPFRSRFSTGAYKKALMDAISGLPSGESVAVRWSQPWAQSRPWLECWAELIRSTVQRHALTLESHDTVVLFTNHSLPVTVQAQGEPYVEEFHSVAETVASDVGARRYVIAYTSAGGGRIPWLGPELTKTLDELPSKGIRKVLVAPIGFLSAHLEVLWDIDQIGREHAHSLNLEFVRTPMPVESPMFLDVLLDMIHQALASARPSEGG